MKSIIVLAACLLLTACGDTVYQQTVANKAAVNSVVVTDGTISSAVVSVTEKELSPDGGFITIYVESSLTNTSISDAYTAATVSAVTSGGLTVKSFPCVVKLKPGESGTYGITTSVSSGAYALVKEWKMSAVWHLPVTPVITDPQVSLEGKYLQIGHLSTTVYSSGGSESGVGALSETVSPVDALLVIQNGVWDQKAAAQTLAGTEISASQTGQYSILGETVTIAGNPSSLLITGDQLTITNPVQCVAGNCTTVTITWQKVSD